MRNGTILRKEKNISKEILFLRENTIWVDSATVSHIYGQNTVIFKMTSYISKVVWRLDNGHQIFYHLGIYVWIANYGNTRHIASENIYHKDLRMEQWMTVEH